MPQHPKAILGICLHGVVEAAHTGRFTSADEGSTRGAARELFDRSAADLHRRAHVLLRAKFSSPERMPYYNLFRERAAVLAVQVVSRQDAMQESALPIGESSGGPRGGLTEEKLTSRDGLLSGRADYIDTLASEIVDYKTGVGPEDEPEGLLDSEARQLRFYAHVARDRGIAVTKGVVVRADGRRVSIALPEDAVAAEGKRAREVLGAINAKVGRSFEEVADPSPVNCVNCPCIPFCEPFWMAAWGCPGRRGKSTAAVNEVYRFRAHDSTDRSFRS